ncbi:MAG: hypothetical protein JWO86_4078 [Myxococcaceae bacterium]|jgi:hypothetical protein|nr:hypothetical protein [Myxococcaceae bacterium]MEA2751268.1 hypothetical protein [Myxococcales bacterium]
MRRALFLLLTFTALLGGFRLLSACLEITPIVVERDARVSASDSCLKCLEAPESCAGIIEQCQQDPRCNPVYACIVREACLDLRTLDDKINCSLPCAQDAGILSATDPVIATYLVGLVGCAQQKCAVACNLSDAGIGL